MQRGRCELEPLLVALGDPTLEVHALVSTPVVGGDRIVEHGAGERVEEVGLVLSPQRVDCRSFNRTWEMPGFQATWQCLADEQQEALVVHL